MSRDSRPWTPAETVDALALWGSGATVTVIADRLGRTRNSVISRLHRRDAAKRPNPVRAKRDGPALNHAWRKDRQAPLKGEKGLRKPYKALSFKFRADAPPEAKKAAWFPPARTEPAGEKVISGCRFIAADPKPDESCFCNLPKQPHSSYCPDHHRRCWVSPPMMAAAAE